MKLNPSSPAAASPASDLAAALIAEGEAHDAETAPPPLDAAGQPIAPTPTIDYNEEAQTLLGLVIGIACQFYPQIEPVWTPARIAGIAAKLGPVMQKYGWSMADLGPYKEEIALAVALVPPLLMTRAIVIASKSAIGRNADTPAAADVAGSPAAAAAAQAEANAAALVAEFDDAPL